MSEPESKKLERLRADFVDALSAWHGGSDYAAPNVSAVRAAHALNNALVLSVLAEEAPPVKEHGGWCPAPNGPCDCGAAPAPKQERHPFSDIELSLQEVLREIAPGDHKTILERVLRLYRDERAAMEDEINYHQSAAGVDRGKLVRVEMENASLRRGVEKALGVLARHGFDDCVTVCGNARRILRGLSEDFFS